MSYNEVRERDQETPIFLITAYGSVEAAVEALKSGANDYFSKPWDNEKLLIEIDRMIAARRLERENLQLKSTLKRLYSFPNIIGTERADAAAARAGDAGRIQPLDNSNYRGDGNWQGSDRTRDPRKLAARR